MPISRPNELDIREYVVRLLVDADEPVSKKRVVGLYQTLNHHEARYRLSPGEAHEVAPGPSARRLLRTSGAGHGKSCADALERGCGWQLSCPAWRNRLDRGV